MVTGSPDVDRRMKERARKLLRESEAFKRGQPQLGVVVEREMRRKWEWHGGLTAVKNTPENYREDEE